MISLCPLTSVCSVIAVELGEIRFRESHSSLSGLPPARTLPPRHSRGLADLITYRRLPRPNLPSCELGFQYKRLGRVETSTFSVAGSSCRFPSDIYFCPRLVLLVVSSLVVFMVSISISQVRCLMPKSMLDEWVDAGELTDSRMRNQTQQR